MRRLSSSLVLLEELSEGRLERGRSQSGMQGIGSDGRVWYAVRGYHVFEQYIKPPTDYRVMHKNREFASLLASVEANRHLPGLRKLLRAKLPGKTFSQAMIVMNLSSPVQLKVMSPNDLRKIARPDGQAHSAKGFEMVLQAANAIDKEPSSGEDVNLTWLQFILPEGETEVVFNQRSKLFEDDFCASTPAERKLRLHRASAVDDGRRTLTARWDVVDEILLHLNFQRTDEWYASGPGSMKQLNEKVEAIILKLQILKSLTERFGIDADKFEADLLK